MEVLIEATRDFEKDLDNLTESEKALAIGMINDCARLFPLQKSQVYRKLHHLNLLSDLNGYASSLYTLRISEKLRVIMTVDEDPIFDQVIFTLFRAVNRTESDQAYQDIAKSLYQDLISSNRETALIS